MTDRIGHRHASDILIGSVDELVARFGHGAKPRAAWRLGAEHEKLGVLLPDGAPVPYHGERGIEALFTRLMARGWEAVREGQEVIALRRAGERVTLEPGGQLELSGDPLPDLAASADEIRGHLAELAGPSRALGIGWLGLGFRPFGRLDDIEWVPKGRYAVMRAELPRLGSRGHDMMKRTATIQANVDYADEEDAGRKLRAAHSVSSLVTALFAASPIADGRDTGMQSVRAYSWLDTDERRCGLLPFVFSDEGGGIFRRYVEWALDVPLLFLYRDGVYREAGGVTFRRFLREGIDGRRPTLDDWDTHLTTLFPEARLKQYLEVRSADAGPLPMVLALPALWKGLLYDDDALSGALAVLGRLGWDERVALRRAVPLSGLTTPLPDGRTVRDAARELVGLARAGLSRVAPAEVGLLAAVEEVAETGRTAADRAREAFARGPAELLSAFLLPTS
jgi:glutamate--cysteine ligase